MSEHHLHPAPQDTASFEAAAQLFKYLSDPTRVRLFFILCHSEKCVIQLSECMEMSSPALSHHLRPLRAARGRRSITALPTRWKRSSFTR